MSAYFKPIRQIKPDAYAHQSDVSDSVRAAPNLGNVIFPRLESYHERNMLPVERPSPENFKQEAAKHYDQGYAAGKREAEHACAATLAALQSALDQLTGSIVTLRSEIEQGYKESVLLCLGHLMPALCEHVLKNQMADVILQAGHDACGDILTVRLHPDNAVARDYLTASAARQQLKLSFESDPQQSTTALHFSWDQSDIHLDPAATVRACLDSIGVIAVPLPEVLSELNKSACPNEEIHGETL